MRRVVFTGYGVVSPLGLTAEETWSALIEGRSGVGPITLFDTSGFEVKMAAEVKGFDPAATLGRRAARRQDRFELFANAAAREALWHSGLEISDANRHRVGLSVSSAFGGLTSMLEEMEVLAERGPAHVSPFGLPKFTTTPDTISIAHGLRGPSFSVASACASGADGIGLAFQLIRAGVVDAMLAGGADAGITTLGIGAFDRMRAYSHRTRYTPSPFSAGRDGIVMGEGAAVLVLESLEHARQRGAEIHVELVGYAATSDAYHITAPMEDGAAGAAAIRLALEDASLDPNQIDYINAHGTGTPLNDVSETRAIKSALGAQAYQVPISATKSMTGHMMGATGALEAMICALAIQHGIVPPTINYLEPDPECDLDYVPDEVRELPIRVAISNAFGFGGHNTVLVLKRFDR